MAETATNLVDESRERISSARERIDEEIQRVQKELASRRKDIELQLSRGRKSFEKQTRRQVRQIQKDIRKNSWIRRAEELRDEATRQFEDALEGVLGTLQIASKTDVRKIDRKLGKLSKRLKEIERVRQTNGQQAPSQL